jgi:hypothetical protein
MELIPGTEPVEIGDFVFTAAPIPGIEDALHLGEVVNAELVSGSAHWSIQVRPAVEGHSRHHVQILRVGLNPTRRMAESIPAESTDQSGAVR